MKTICYCFSYTDDDVIEDVFGHGGRSTIEERISREKQAGTCDCAHKNPTGQ